jgi:hypothetical protein
MITTTTTTTARYLIIVKKGTENADADTMWAEDRTELRRIHMRWGPAIVGFIETEPGQPLTPDLMYQLQRRAIADQSWASGR